MPEPTTSKRLIASAERRKQVVQMRLAGASYQEIADALGITASGAYRAVKTWLDKTHSDTLESAEQLRDIENARLDKLILSAMPQAQKGHLQAIEVVRKLSESKRKLLGLDAPEKQQIQQDTKVVIEYTEIDDPKASPNRDEDTSRG